MTAAAFLAFANQPVAELRGLQTHGARYIAAAAGQVLAALDAKSLGDATLMRAHLERARGYWTKSQEAQEAQERDATAKVVALKADGIGRDIEERGVTHGGPHMAMGDTYVRNGQARGESAIGGRR